MGKLPFRPRRALAAARLGTRALALSLALALASPSPASPQSATTPTAGRQTALGFQRNVVRIIPKTADGQDGPAGFGIVLGERDGLLFIATPDHVVRGSDELGATPDVIFFAEQGRRHAARRLEELRIPPAQGDLAVVEVPRPANFRATTIPIVTANAVPDAAPVWNIGRTERWLVPTSPGGFQGIDPQTNHLLVEDLPTPPGSSGGAVLTERALLGMTLRDSGAQRLTFVFRADRMVEIFQQWQLPVNFVQRGAPTATPAPAPTAGASTRSTAAAPRAAQQPPAQPPPRPPATQPASRSTTTPRAPAPQAVQPEGECDRLATQADDPQKAPGIAGVSLDELRPDADEAIRVCTLAIRQSPSTMRFSFQLARALLAQGRSAQAYAPARSAAEGGHVKAQILVAQMHERGRGAAVDYSQARQWYEKAAASGDQEAVRALSRMGQSFGSPFVRPSQR